MAKSTTKHVTLLNFFLFALLFTGAMPLVHAQRLRGFTVSPEVGAKDLDVLTSWNANLVRYNVYWGEPANSATAEEYLAWLDLKLEKLRQVLNWAAGRNLKVVVTLHTPPGGFRGNESPAVHRLFTDAWAREAYIVAWQRIAAEVNGNPTVWGYDLLNEPAIGFGFTFKNSWRVLAAEVAKAIRAVDPKPLIIVQPPYGDQSRLSAIRTLSIPRMVISIHAYYPWNFHHQGLYGQPLGLTYPTARLTKATLAKNLRAARRFQQQRKVPIYVGEFTAIRWAPKNSAYNYLTDILPILERYRWHWTYHSFREADPWSLEHSNDYGDTRRTLVETTRASLVKGYLARNR